MVKINDQASPLFEGLQGSVLPAAIFHIEGQASYPLGSAVSESHVVMQYVNEQAQVTERYPANPDGSQLGHCGFVNKNGRVFVSMAHIEAICYRHQLPWSPAEWRDYTPWMQVFLNLRKACKPNE